MNWQSAGIALFAFAIVCEQAHVVSPIALAWSHPGLRRIALSRPIETLLLPLIAIVVALAVPFMVIWWIYWVWNIYHFGAQHYGVLSIYRQRTNRNRKERSLWNGDRWSLWRRLNPLGGTLSVKLACIGGTAAIMVGMPWFVQAGWVGWFLLVAIDFNHWLVDLGLSSRVSQRWWLFLAVVAALGCIGFAWKSPQPDHIATMLVPWILQARWGVGIAHFLYSRWVWKLSDPRVRAAIGEAFAST